MIVFIAFIVETGNNLPM